MADIRQLAREEGVGAPTCCGLTELEDGLKARKAGTSVIDGIYASSRRVCEEVVRLQASSADDLLALAKANRIPSSVPRSVMIQVLAQLASRPLGCLEIAEEISRAMRARLDAANARARSTHGLPRGLSKVLLRAGSGPRVPPGAVVRLHHHARLENGE